MNLIDKLINIHIFSDNPTEEINEFWGNIMSLPIREIEEFFETDVMGYETNSGFFYACKSGRIECIEFMLSKNPTNFLSGFEGACLSKNLDVIDLLFKKCSDDGINILFRKNQTSNELTEYIIKKGVEYQYDDKNFNKYLLEKCLRKKFIKTLLILNQDLLSEICEYL